MWDPKTGRSRGFGFVVFRERAQAEKAISAMNGEFLGSRAIRCNWANQKGQPSATQQQAMAQMGMATGPVFGQQQYSANGAQSYDVVVQQSGPEQTNCWVGNLSPYTSQHDIIDLFRNFGHVMQSRFHTDRGFAFVRMDSHEHAAMAISRLHGYNVNGRPLRCSASLLPGCI